MPLNRQQNTMLHTPLNISNGSLGKFAQCDATSATTLFNQLHPQYLQISEWQKRLEYFESNQIKMCSEDIMLWLLGKGESNFKIVAHLLTSQVDCTQVRSELLQHFVIQKLTETKLELQIVHILETLPPRTKLELLVSGAKFNVGKKAIRYLEFLEKVHIESEKMNTTVVDELKNIKYTGMNEKKKLSSVVEALSARKFEDDSKDVEESHNKETTSLNTNSVYETTYQSQNIAKQVECDEPTFVQEVDHSILIRPTKFTLQNYSGIIVGELRGKNIIYINDLLIFLIQNDIVLSENEVVALVDYLASSQFVQELTLIDRVYPISKLYTMYKCRPDLLNPLLKIVKRLIKVDVPDAILLQAIEETDQFVDLIQKLVSPNLFDLKDYNDAVSQLLNPTELSHHPYSNQHSNHYSNRNNKDSDNKFNDNKISDNKDRYTDYEDLKRNVMREEHGLRESIERITLSSKDKNEEKRDYYSELRELKGDDEVLLFFDQHSLSVHRLINQGNQDKALRLLVYGKHIKIEESLLEIIEHFLNENEILMFIITSYPFVKVFSALFDLMNQIAKSKESSPITYQGNPTAYKGNPTAYQGKLNLVMKLIWRHSRDVSKYVDLNSCGKEEEDRRGMCQKRAQNLIDEIDRRYKKHADTLCDEDLIGSTGLKVALFHTNELCQIYSTNVVLFKCSGSLVKILRYLVSGRELVVEEIREIYRRW